MADSNIYDYVLGKVDATKILEHYNLTYENKGSNKNYVWICCPFHAGDRDPSLSVNLDRNIFKCWGCKKVGNIFSFIVEIELILNGNDISYYDAMLLCCKLCDIRINLTFKEKLELEMADMDDVSDILNEEISDVNENVQQETFLETAIKKFYVKKNNYMVDKGYPKEILDYLEMGFLAGDPKNNMNNRCVFPVRNINGKLVGWTGRSILPNSKVKWFHAPPSRFLKSLNLYNIDKAISHIIETNEVNVVESVGNTIRMLESGRFNTVATLGSTISREQCAMLESFGVTIVFWYDWDSGGFEGLNLVMNYMANSYDLIKIAITDYGVSDEGKSKDIGNVTVSEVNATKIISIYEYIDLMKERYVYFMSDNFEKDSKIKLTDGTNVLCTNKLNVKLDMPQLIPEDVDFFKTIESLFGVNELSMDK